MMSADPAGFKAAVQESLAARWRRSTRWHGARHALLGLRQRLPARGGARAEADLKKRMAPSLPVLRRGHHGADVLRLRLRAVPLGVHLRRSEDLQATDAIAAEVLERHGSKRPRETKQQLLDNLRWIRQAERERAGGRLAGAHPLRRGAGAFASPLAFNDAIAAGRVSAPDGARPRSPRRLRYRLAPIARPPT